MADAAVADPAARAREIAAKLAQTMGGGAPAGEDANGAPAGAAPTEVPAAEGDISELGKRKADDGEDESHANGDAEADPKKAKIGEAEAYNPTEAQEIQAATEEAANAADAAAAAAGAAPSTADALTAATQAAAAIAASLPSATGAAAPDAAGSSGTSGWPTSGAAPASTMGSAQYAPPGSHMPASAGMGPGAYGPGAAGGGMEEMNFEIPNAMVGVVIGRGGENIQKIQREYGISIQITKAQDIPPDAQSRPVNLKGTRAAIDAAKRDIDGMIAERQAGLSSGLGMMGGGGGGSSAPYMSHYGGAGQYGPRGEERMTMAIPNDRVGLVIGKAGGTIKGMQQRTGANIQIPQQPDADDQSRRTITITAPSKQQLDLAMREVQNVVDAGPQGTGPSPGSNTVILQVANERVGLLIGKGGVTIKDLQNRSGARIQIPPQPDPGSNMRSVSITGVGDAPMRAKYEMEQMLNGGFDPQAGGGGGGYGAPQHQPHAGGGYGAPHASPYGHQAPHQPHMPYGASPYGQPAYGAPPHSSPYGMPPMGQQPGYGYDARYSQPGLSDPYAHQYGGHAQAHAGHAHTPAAQSPAPAAAASAGGVDLTQYHTQFWQYAAYYGERVAREQYGAWSPPVGTQPPPGIVLPAPGQEQPPPQH